MSIKVTCCQHKGPASLKWLGNMKIATHYIKEDSSLSGKKSWECQVDGSVVGKHLYIQFSNCTWGLILIPKKFWLNLVS